MWRYGTGSLPATAAQVAAVTVPSFLTMDVWLTNLLTTAPKATLNDVRTHAGRRGQAGRRLRLQHLDGRHDVLDAGHRHGAVRR